MANYKLGDSGVLLECDINTGDVTDIISPNSRYAGMARVVRDTAGNVTAIVDMHGNALATAALANYAYDGVGNIIGFIDGTGATIPLIGVDRTITASANAVLADAGGLITANHATVAIVITIEADATIGWANDSLLAAYQAGAAAVSFAAGAGVTLHSPTGIAAATQYGTIAALRVAANEWTLV